MHCMWYLLTNSLISLNHNINCYPGTNFQIVKRCFKHRTQTIIYKICQTGLNIITTCYSSTINTRPKRLKFADISSKNFLPFPQNFSSILIARRGNESLVNLYGLYTKESLVTSKVITMTTVPYPSSGPFVFFLEVISCTQPPICSRSLHQIESIRKGLESIERCSLRKGQEHYVSYEH